MKTKRILSMLIAVIMVFGLLPCYTFGAEAGEHAFARRHVSDMKRGELSDDSTYMDAEFAVENSGGGATPALPVESDNTIYVGGVEMGDGDYLANGASETTKTIPASSGYAYYSDGILELNSYEYEGVGHNYTDHAEGEDAYSSHNTAIFAEAPLEIVLVETSKLTNTSDGGEGISTYGALTIGGEGELIIDADAGINNIDSTLDINDINLTFKGISTMAIFSHEDINITDAGIDIIDNSNNASYGICSDASIGIYDGIVNMKTRDGGIVAAENITIYDGKTDITVEGEDWLFGIDGGNVNIEGDITINMIVTGGIVGYVEVSGISSEGDVILRGTVKIEGGFYAVVARGDMEVRGELDITSKNGLYSIYGDVVVRETSAKVVIDSEVAIASSNEINIAPYLAITLPEGAAHIGYDEEGVKTILNSNDECAGQVTIRYDENFETELYIGGIEMTEGTYLANGAHATSETIPASGGYAYYGDGILTLNNYEYDGDGYCYDVLEEDLEVYALIYAQGPLDIELVGSNYLGYKTIDDFLYDGIAVDSPETTTISGEGSLIIDVGECAIFTYEDLIIDGCELDLYGDYTVWSYFGNITLRNSDVYIEAYYSGIETDFEKGGEHKLEISGGTLYIESEAYGVITDNVHISDDADVTIDCNYAGGTGIWAYNDVTIDAKAVNIIAVEEGIVAADNILSIDGGTVKISSVGYALVGREILLNGGFFDLNSADGLFDAEGAEISDDLYIYIPVDGYIVSGESGDEIVDSEGEPVLRAVLALRAEHAQSEEYAISSTHHWHPCADADCFMNEYPEACDGYAEHTADGICICGYDSNKEAEIYVGGIGLAEGEYLGTGNIICTEKPEDNYAHYSNGVLTLNNYEYNGNGYMFYSDDEYDEEYTAAIFSEKALKVVLQGENSISNTHEMGDGIVSNEDVIIEGTGSLDINVNGDAVYAYGVTVNEGVLRFITQYKGIEVMDGGIVINGGDIDIHAYDNSLYSTGDIKITGGKIVLTSIDDEAIYVYSMDANFARGGDVLISGGEVTCNTYDDGDGIDVENIYGEEGYIRGANIVISGGVVNIHVDDEALEADGNVEISGGTVNITARGYGIYIPYQDIAENDLEYKVGSVLISGGDVTIISWKKGIFADGIYNDQQFIQGADTTISGGTVNITSAYTGMMVSGHVKFSNGHTRITANTSNKEGIAIEAGEIILGKNVKILNPQGGVIAEQSYATELPNPDGDGFWHAIEDAEGNLVTTAEIKYHKPSSGSPSGSSVKNTTTKNEDGSTTTVTDNKETGTKTETTTYPDGSYTQVETKKDGTVTTTEKNDEGKITTTEEKPDGTIIKTETSPDGETKSDIVVLEGSEAEVTIPVPDAEEVTKVVVTDKDGNVTEITDFEVTEKGVKISVSADCSVSIEVGDSYVPTKKTFSDVHPLNHWAAADVDYVYEKGLMNGISEDLFDPDAKVTRAMLVTILYRLEGEPELADAGVVPFVDIDVNAYYQNAVFWAQQNSIVNGISETEFAPNESITREQIAAIMFRYAVYKGMDAVTLEENLYFDDASDISEYAISAMNWAVGSGLINGKTETTLSPKDFATRAEIAAIIHRFIEANK